MYIYSGLDRETLYTPHGFDNSPTPKRRRTGAFGHPYVPCDCSVEVEQHRNERLQVKKGDTQVDDPWLPMADPDDTIRF